jgi:hypothetical protein
VEEGASPCICYDIARPVHRNLAIPVLRDLVVLYTQAWARFPLQPSRKRRSCGPWLDKFQEGEITAISRHTTSSQSPFHAQSTQHPPLQHISNLWGPLVVLSHDFLGRFHLLFRNLADI